MTWLVLIKALLALANALIGHVSAKQLLDAGQAQALAKGYSDAVAILNAALAARNGVRDSSVARRKPGGDPPGGV